LRASSQRTHEQGVIITLVAVFMLFVVGAMAALAIDVVTIYTARSEAQLAADGAALAGARVLANSGMTSNTTDVGLASSAEGLASAIAIQVATNNAVGGSNLLSSEVTVSFPNAGAGVGTDPEIKVTILRSTLPTFFARVWGRTQFTAGASATAEAYNPSGMNALGETTIPVAPICVKPWLLPNLDPTSTTGGKIFDPVTGAIVANPTLLGWVTPAAFGSIRLRTKCSTTNVIPGTADCLPASANTPVAWQYYPADPADFPPPNASSVGCSTCAGFTNPSYQLAIAGCVQTPISCTSTGPPAQIVNVEVTSDGTRDAETGVAVNGLTNSNGGLGDKVDTAAPPSPPFQFVAGDDNPIVLSGAMAGGTDIMVSDSLVTVPVINADNVNWPPPAYPQVQIIGFVQLFLNPTGAAALGTGHIHTEVINMTGCGSGASGTAILGNGVSPVAVRLISP
jgi:hypothetical protein